MKEQPDWLNKEVYPFQSQWMTIHGHNLHYIDEGTGPLLLFLHGTPEWSFGYRDLIKALRKDFRCVAPDMLGFGLSDKPAVADYTVPGHANRLENLIHELQLKNIILVANDFGAGIGMNYILNYPANVTHIILFNTWMWSLKEDRHFAGPARIMNSWLGKLLYLRFNFPVEVVMPSAFGDRKKLTKEIHGHYRKALPDAKSRVGVFAFAKELMNASGWWQANWERMSSIQDKPFLIFWGMKDKFVPPSNLEKWKERLPDAKIITFKDAGHFVQEEKANEMIESIRNFATGRINK